LIIALAVSFIACFAFARLSFKFPVAANKASLKSVLIFGLVTVPIMFTFTGIIAGIAAIFNFGSIEFTLANAFSAVLIISAGISSLGTNNLMS